MSKLQRAWMPLLILHLFSVFVFLLQITSGAYVEQFLESVEVCTSAAVGPFSNIAKKKIRLQNYPNNTVMVRLTRWDEFWPSFLNFRCKFQVTAPKKFGVMVVIQAMHLRTKKPAGVGCRDWIKFEQDDGFKTTQICGELDDNDYSKAPENVIGQRFFYDNRGQMDVSFSTDDQDPEDEKKPVFLKMIFTAFQECSEMAMAQRDLKRCSSLRTHSCISSNLFCDKEINCGFNDSDFGSDERECDSSGRKGKSSDSSSERPASLYVFAVTCIATLLLVILLVFLACCCVRRFGTRHQPPSHVSQLSPFQEHMEFHMINAGPTLPTVMTSEIIEKRIEDLPPSYDALFPTSEQTKKQQK